VPGIEKEIVVPYSHVLDGQAGARKETIVVGGGPTGCEVAYHLSEQGCPVTLVEMLPKMGNRLETMTRKLLLRKLRENQVRFMTECRLSRIEDEGVVVTDKEDQDLFLEAQRVVITIGNRPDNELYSQIEPSGFEIHQIGDCLEPRSAKAAIYEGAVLGRSI
jgi:pyruvate/2-oxoglutarate dehydrogenase complex dihydrolipoamide dehydrogenase (E3) component